MTRQTSVETYRLIESDGLLSKRRFEVYSILFNSGPLTAHEIVATARKQYPLANQTGFNARLSELEKLGVVETVGEKNNPVSGHKNLLWDVTDKLPSKLEKPARVKCKHCGGRGYFETQQSKLF